MLSRNSDDFNIENGHARLSQRKVAELLKTNQSTVSRVLTTDALFDTSELEVITQRGFDGDALSDLLDYFLFDAKRVSVETKRHCRNIYRKAAAKGFQDFIDAIAGIERQDLNLRLAQHEEDIEELEENIEELKGQIQSLIGYNRETYQTIVQIEADASHALSQYEQLKEEMENLKAKLPDEDDKPLW